MNVNAGLSDFSIAEVRTDCGTVDGEAAPNPKSGLGTSLCFAPPKNGEGDDVTGVVELAALGPPKLKENFGADGVTRGVVLPVLAFSSVGTVTGAKEKGAACVFDACANIEGNEDEFWPKVNVCLPCSEEVTVDADG